MLQHAKPGLSCMPLHRPASRAQCQQLQLAVLTTSDGQRLVPWPRLGRTGAALIAEGPEVRSTSWVAAAAADCSVQLPDSSTQSGDSTLRSAAQHPCVANVANSPCEAKATPAEYTPDGVSACMQVRALAPCNVHVPQKGHKEQGPLAWEIMGPQRSTASHPGTATWEPFPGHTPLQ